jgi:hypothetical protein
VRDREADGSEYQSFENNFSEENRANGWL